MDAVLRGLAIYAVLLVIFRIAGKRTLASMTAFDFVLLLVVAEATQQALLGDDFSVTNGIVVISTLIAADIGFSLIKQRSPRFSRAADGLPLVILEDGKPIEHRMKRARIDESDILASGRQTQGIERLDEIKYAVLEEGGTISIIPHRSSAG